MLNLNKVRARIRQAACLHETRMESDPEYRKGVEADQAIYDAHQAEADEMKAPEQQPSIKCPVCFFVSYNPNDIAEGYCGHCHQWTSDGSERHGR